MTMVTEKEEVRENERKPESKPQPRVFKGSEEFQSNRLHSFVALIVFTGAAHLTLALFFGSFMIPLSKGVLVLGFLAILVYLPINEKSRFGSKLTRYICKHACSYFPMTLHVEDIKAFHPDRSYVFGFEPHSVLPFGVIALSNGTGFMPLPKIKILASNSVFRTPFVRHIWTWFGIAAVTKKNFISLLEAGCSCVIVPGGVHETALLERDSEIIFLKTRKGFVRVAMETGSPLVPVFCFGQSNVFKWVKPSGERYLKICKAWKFNPMYFWGVWGTPLPFSRPLDIVVGKPIEIKKNPQPSVEEIDEAHSQFVEALQDLFERYKAEVGCPDRQLKIL
ncbi:Diacylglycerol O-acyltransferase 2 [Morella rubra]|uniref:Acyltransferase n=1 Tax=Morella rubra TaxID=262757 RepID=A0A6A1WFH0_9ROSI|nr:Diacylglycerol O-acyltransferase 2 [Morella rubra]